MSGHFSKSMMEDWANDDKKLLSWRAATGETAFEKTKNTEKKISEQEFRLIFKKSDEAKNKNSIYLKVNIYKKKNRR